MTTPAEQPADPSSAVLSGGKRLGRPLGELPTQIATPVTPLATPPKLKNTSKNPPWLLWLATASTLALLLLIISAARMPRGTLTLPGTSPSVQSRPTGTAQQSLRGATGPGGPMNLLPPRELRLDMVQFISGGSSPVLHLRDGTTLNVSSLSPAQVQQLPGNLRERLEYSRAHR